MSTLGYEKPPVALPVRIFASLGIIVFCLCVLALRLWYLQVVKGEYFRVLSENNRLKTVYIPPPRGNIVDGEGEVLVRNQPAFNIEFVREDSPDPEGTIQLLGDLLGADPKELEERLQNQKARRRYEPKILLKNVDRDVVGKVLARSYALPGILVNTFPAREYVYDGLGAHVLGYIREISREQLESSRYSGYRGGDLVGQYGLEMKWERLLQGSRGKQEVIVNAMGIRTADLSSQPAVPGRNLRLSLDRDVQAAADEALLEQRGAIVALDPRTGFILAMASSPHFNPNIFSGEMSADVWRELLTSPEKPLNNRAVQGAYPPGSVFKVFMAVAGLAEGVVTPSERISCPGGYRFGSRTYHCHKRSGHGSVNLHEALVVSCDVYFYILGQRLGVDRISAYSHRFGLGEPTGLDLVQENPGLIPSTEWKKRRFAGTEEERWYPGETLSVSIGQGATLSTPLQLARGVAAIINGGRVLKPQLVQEIFSSDGRYRDEEFPVEEQKRVDVDAEILEAVRKAMVGVVNDPQGTARRAKLPEDFGIIVGGKTGTSQVVSLDKHKEGTKLGHHAWFVGFAPAEKPEIVVAVIAENAGGGGANAAPRAQKVLEAYFRDTRGLGKEATPTKE